MNRFYELKIGVQWIVAIAMFFTLLIVQYVFFKGITGSPLGFFLLFLIAPLIQFLASPFFTLIGTYKYLSPMLLVYSPNVKKYDLHNGTSFDYLLVMKGVKPGIEWRNKLLVYYLEGLLKIVDEIENNGLPGTVEIKGTSYFFSERTAKRLGFKIKAAGFTEKFNLVLNFIDLTWMYSLAYGRFMLPSLSKIKMASIGGDELVRNKEALIRIKLYLDK